MIESMEMYTLTVYALLKINLDFYGIPTRHRSNTFNYNGIRAICIIN